MNSSNSKELRDVGGVELRKDEEIGGIQQQYKYGVIPDDFLRVPGVYRRTLQLEKDERLAAELARMNATTNTSNQKINTFKNDESALDELDELSNKMKESMKSLATKVQLATKSTVSSLPSMDTLRSNLQKSTNSAMQAISATAAKAKAKAATYNNNNNKTPSLKKKNEEEENNTTNKTLDEDQVSDIPLQDMNNI